MLNKFDGTVKISTQKLDVRSVQIHWRLDKKFLNLKKNKI